MHAATPVNKSTLRTHFGYLWKMAICMKTLILLPYDQTKGDMQTVTKTRITPDTRKLLALVSLVPFVMLPGCQSGIHWASHEAMI